MPLVMCRGGNGWHWAEIRPHNRGRSPLVAVGRRARWHRQHVSLLSPRCHAYRRRVTATTAAARAARRTPWPPMPPLGYPHFRRTDLRAPLSLTCVSSQSSVVIIITKRRHHQWPRLIIIIIHTFLGLLHSAPPRWHITYSWCLSTCHPATRLVLLPETSAAALSLSHERKQPTRLDRASCYCSQVMLGNEIGCYRAVRFYRLAATLVTGQVLVGWSVLLSKTKTTTRKPNTKPNTH